MLTQNLNMFNFDYKPQNIVYHNLTINYKENRIKSFVEVPDS